MQHIAVLDRMTATVTLDKLPSKWDTERIEEWIQDMGWNLGEVNWITCNHKIAVIGPEA